MVTAVDNAAPQGMASGALVTDPVLTGTPSVTVDASDKGAGLYALQILIDGQVQSSTPFAGRPCSDVDQANGDPFEFSSVIPCPLRKILTVGLDTSQLGDDVYHRRPASDRRRRRQRHDARRPGGRRRLARSADRILRSEDTGASRTRCSTSPSPGNPTAPEPPRERSCVCTSPSARASSSGAASTASHRKRVTRAASQRTVGFSSRPTLRAVLTDTARRPIAGAHVFVATRPKGQDWQITGPPLTTSRTGRIGLRLPARSPSRQVNLVYFPFSDSHEQAVGRPAELKVRAGVALSISRRRVRNGQRVNFNGRVAGPLARRGVAVSLQVKLGRRYRTFRAIRVTASDRGRFSTAYRFTTTSRTTRYSFRALVTRQAGMPYERGVSPTRTVVVTP